MIRGFAVIMAVCLLAGTQAAAAEAIVLNAGMTVDFEFVDPLNSKANKVGDTFAIRLSRPIAVNGITVLPKDALGRGEVIHAARARAGGKGGELIVMARYIEHEGRKIPLRSLRYGKSGENNTTTAMVIAFAAGPLAYLVVGGEVNVPVGTPANAKIAETVEWSPEAIAASGQPVKQGEQ